MSASETTLADLGIGETGYTFPWQVFYYDGGWWIYSAMQCSPQPGGTLRLELTRLDEATLGTKDSAPEVPELREPGVYATGSRIDIVTQQLRKPTDEPSLRIIWENG